tara:strand:+ start:370 stop:774 length:405 start_codon:yes stop_codon:yes gene_type:complete
MQTTTKLETLAEAINAEPARSAWSKGVKLYALELIEDVDLEGLDVFDDETRFSRSIADGFRKKALLNGAQDWRQFSEGGCALIYDADIAERLCSPSELKRVKGGDRDPNANETWLDCQARALFQACNMVLRLAR